MIRRMAAKAMGARRSGLVLGTLTMAILGALGTGVAMAEIPITQFSVTPSSTQAGGHPDLRTLFVVENEQLRNQQHSEYAPCGCRDPKAVSVHLPPGVIGVPDAVPKCNDAEFGSAHCSPDSQVGVLEAGLGGEDLEEEPKFLGEIPVYNLVPHPSEAALLGATLPVIDAPIYFVFTPRTGGDYGLDERTLNIAHPLFGLHFVNLDIWGVPADPSHQEERTPVGCDPSPFTNPNAEGCHPGVPSTAPLVPFTINPTTCGDTNLAAGVEVLGYERELSTATTTFPATTGCDQLSFNPSLFAQPTATATDTPSGLAIDLKVPQDLSPETPSASEIRTSIVTLPQGFSINANAADGKEACSDLQARFGTEEEAQCPENAKIGTLSIETPTLPGPLPGYVYLGEPKPGERYRLVLTADGFNVHVKLPGTVEANPQTGQLTVVFRDLPQFPFSDFNMHLFGAERGSLATPTECGTFPVDSTFIPWDSLLPEQTSAQYFTVGSGAGGSSCPAGARSFKPAMEAGVTDKTAGAHAPFVLRLTRNDGDQDVSGLSVTTPPGFSATLAGIPYCPQAALDQLASPLRSGLTELASPACPAASQVGTAVAGVGAGSRPLYVSGKVYLAGPYKGAPLSLEVVIPAVSGPYDLGNVAERAAIEVNPSTAQVSAVSDPLPQIIDGIPLRTRSIRVSLDRPGFALNPTNCSPLAVEAQIAGAEGAHANLSSHFQVADCANLPFGPKLALKLRGSMKRTGNPALTAVLTAKPGEAGIASVSTTMPHALFLDNAHVGNPCTRVQFAANACPPSSVLGTARAETPLLANPLEGPVYLMSGYGHKLPDLIADLHGQLHVILDGRIDSVHQRLRTRFQTVPDVPVSRFTLRLAGGKKGLLENSEPLCAAKPRATVRMVGQNGRVAKSRNRLRLPCGKAAHRSRHRHGRER